MLRLELLLDPHYTICLFLAHREDCALSLSPSPLRAGDGLRPAALQLYDAVLVTVTQRASPRLGAARMKGQRGIIRGVAAQTRRATTTGTALDRSTQHVARLHSIVQPAGSCNSSNPSLQARCIAIDTTNSARARALARIERRVSASQVASLTSIESHSHKSTPPRATSREGWQEEWTWEPVIGVEVHAQLASRQKLFSPASLTSNTSAKPNTLVSPFDASLPGTLPRLSTSTLNLAIRAALALGCHINLKSGWDRKHYFYPDLTTGWQITQKYAPFASDGSISLSASDIDGHRPKRKDEPLSLPAEETRNIRIERVQLEQDTSKSFHSIDGSTNSPQVLIDLNRMGSPLIEIVGLPDLKSAKEAAGYVRKVQQVLRAVGASNANMDEGSLRCDVNVSVSKRRRRSESSASGTEGQAAEEMVGGTRCEIKNLNSARFVAIAIDYEIARQISILQSGSSVSQDTMGFDEATGKTYVMRSKSDAPEYRYMPDPSLPDLVLRQEDVRGIEEDAAELPAERRQRLLKRFAGCGVGEREVDVLCRMDEEMAFQRENERALRWGASGKQIEEEQAYLDPVQYFEKVVTGKEQHDGRTLEFNDADRAIDERFARDPKVVMNWLINDVAQALKQSSGQSAVTCTCTTTTSSFGRFQKLFPHEAFGEMLDLVKQKKLTSTSARKFLRDVVDGDVRLDQVSSSSSSDRIYELLKEAGMLALSASLAHDGDSVVGAGTAGHATSPQHRRSESTTKQDPTPLLAIVQQVVRHSPDEVRAIKRGKEKVLMKLVGLVMKGTKGRADPLLVRRMLQQELMKS
ncbi:hypothetical protein IE81DRAFT_324951 [Ceraceosorus guamensis]|uniref:Glutamyl-tRNA(Gln) amidotransferase subunit B, mitochondrial n=1 Tax=Ceraceosorus guamensis TaxID=1522189 RepID=A0A316VZX4_9BASI|nr:hypothetical protein IE81DRAFT_324951 [Ceraceosorus guamensis]PWN41035.1 hypothetical protein IE81DRAFT_324951 [Ceraceosorus guamensis]